MTNSLASLAYMKDIKGTEIEVIIGLEFPIDRADIWVGGYLYDRGASLVTKIEVYQETGQMAHVPWFAVYSGRKILARVNAAHVAIVHTKPVGESDDNKT